MCIHVLFQISCTFKSIATISPLKGYLIFVIFGVPPIPRYSQTITRFNSHHAGQMRLGTNSLVKYFGKCMLHSLLLFLLLFLLMLLFWPCLLLLIIFYLLVVNKCVSEAPESYYWVFVDVVDVGVGVVVVVIVVIINVIVVALLVVTDHIISSCGQ